MVALVIYEFAATFFAEIQLFWRKKLTAAALLFVLNRHIALATFWYQLVVQFYGASTVQVCLYSIVHTNRDTDTVIEVLISQSRPFVGEILSGDL